jgi:REP element-mobilizing transposase RayT
MTRYNGYRSGTIRHDDWEYRRAGWYFVTICTGNDNMHGGRVRNGIVGLSAAGCIAAREWQRTPVVRPYVRLDVWIVMPGNVHGLIDITTDSPACSGDTPPGHPNVYSSRRDESTESLDAKSADEFRLRAHSLGAIIGRYKSVCTKQIRGDGRPEFEWQSRFYDRIIRDAEAFRAVRRYIRAHLDKSAVRNEEDGFDLHS